MSFNFDEEKYFSVVLHSHSVLEMANFIVQHRFPRVMPLMDETFQKIFHESKPTLILFLISSGRVLKNFKNLTMEYPQMNIAYTNLGSSNSSRANEYLMDFTGIKRQDAPLLLYLPFTPSVNGVMPKYKTNKLSVKNMKAFIESGLKGELEVFKKSQENDDDNSVRKYTRVTLNNFDDKVINQKKFFLLGIELFQPHTPTDIKKVFKDFSMAVTDMGMDDILEAGICDMYKNEILEKIQITSLPYIVLVDKDDKTKRHIYTGKLKARNMREWVQDLTGLEIGDYVKKNKVNDINQALGELAASDSEL